MSVSPLVFLCVIGFLNTFSIGAFPVLLPEIGRAGQFGDFELGVVAAAFGFARLLSDIPIALYITHHLRRGMLAAPVVLAAGVVCISIGGPLPMLVLGRALIGAGHALGTLSSLTAILRYREEHRLSFSLSAFDMATMIGMVGGMTLVGALPKTWPWNVAFLVACAPQVVAIFLLPRLLAALPRDTRRAPMGRLWRHAPGGDGTTPNTSHPITVWLAFAAAAGIALAWAAVGQFILPMRAGGEFGLDRGGVASLLALPQLVDVILLLPIGIIADKKGRSAALGVVLLTFAAGVALIAFGSLRMAILGCVLLGIGLAGWVLPLGLLRTGTPPHRLAWRTAQYRIAIDAGIFLGPFLSGFLGEGALWMLSASAAASLAVLGIAMLLYRPPPIRR